MLSRYWPEDRAIDDCIKNEAETIDDAVLLAVHQPMQLMRRAEGSLDETTVSEQDLLDAFTTDNVPGGYVLLPITGVSGAGKSHIIRWLAAQLQRSSRHDRYHIIRIPKSASLRKVVELILDPLKDDPQYASLWDDLARAVAEVNPDNAAVTFRAHLENALTARAEVLASELSQNPAKRELNSLRGFARELPRLFSDAALEEHFRSILKRVISRALEGRSTEAEQHETLSRFVADDLILPAEVDITEAARQVHAFYQRNIANASPEQLQSAIDLLNDAIDPAISNVFQLEQSTRGVTLQDIILSVREILFREGKDLVLLVEDFAALAGIQDVLLKVCIQEGEYAGKKVRATMRTALALTDGYLAFRDTILTRARFEWVVGGIEQSDKDIMASVIQMTGAYLNAARWGAPELRRLFQMHRSDQSLTNWLPVWRDDDQSDTERKELAAFGSTDNKIPLFPFNRAALDILSVRFLKIGGRLELNPRRVINQILRPTLLLRQLFTTHEFPPPAFREIRLNATLTNWLRERNVSPRITQRLSSLLAVWGGNPPEVDELQHIETGLFGAFRLPTPRDLGNIGFVAPRAATIRPTTKTSDTPQESPKEATKDVAPITEDDRVTAMRQKLEEWVAGTEQLNQTTANLLRKALMEMVKDALDFPAMRINADVVNFVHQWIEIPRARGNLNPKIQLAADATDPDGSLRSGLLAAYRHVALNGRQWSYPQGDEDYIASAPLIDHLLKQVRAYIVDTAQKETVLLCRTLIMQGRIAGLEPAIKLSTPELALKALFTDPPVREIQNFEQKWDTLRSRATEEIDGISGRHRLQAEVLRRAAAAQGSRGHTTYAIDGVRLLDALASTEPDRAIQEKLPNDIKKFCDHFSKRQVDASISSVISNLKTFRNEIEDYIDDRFDKAAFVSDLESVCRLIGMTHLNIRPNVPLQEFEQQLSEFKNRGIKTLVEKVTIITDGGAEHLAKTLNALGTLDYELIDRTRTFLRHVATLIGETEKSIAREETDRRQVDPQKTITEITDMLAAIAQRGGTEAIR